MPSPVDVRHEGCERCYLQRFNDEYAAALEAFAKAGGRIAMAGNFKRKKAIYYVTTSGMGGDLAMFNDDAHHDNAADALLWWYRRWIGATK